MCIENKEKRGYQKNFFSTGLWEMYLGQRDVDFLLKVVRECVIWDPVLPSCLPLCRHLGNEEVWVQMPAEAHRQRTGVQAVCRAAPYQVPVTAGRNQASSAVVLSLKSFKSCWRSNFHAKSDR